MSVRARSRNKQDGKRQRESEAERSWVTPTLWLRCFQAVKQAESEKKILMYYKKMDRMKYFAQNVR